MDVSPAASEQPHVGTSHKSYTDVVDSGAACLHFLLMYHGLTNQAFLVENVSAAETIKAMAVEPQVLARWDENLAAYVKSSFKAVLLARI